MIKKITLLLAILALSACLNDKDSKQDPDIFDPRIYSKSYTPIFTSVDCNNFEGVSIDGIDNVECGTLTVPESRYDVENLSQITLAVAVLKSSNATPKSPIIYLHGGPGGSSLQFIEWFTDSVFKEAITERDIILVDQRGGGDSTPSLACPEIIEFQVEKLQNITTETEITDEFDFDLAPIEACKERIQNDGTDLSAYTTIENASDINDLRIALNIEQWNLYGVSYGGTLAQTIMRYYPEGVRSTVLDSPAPIANSVLDIESEVKLYSLLNDILKECAQDVSCNEKYPSLEERFWDRIVQLNETPELVEIKISNFDIDIKSAPFDGGTFIGAITYLIDVNLGRAVPRIITQILNENYQVPIAILADKLRLRNFSDGALFSMTCADEKKKNYTGDHIDNVDLPDRFDTNRRAWREFFDAYQEICRNWPHSQTLGLTPDPLSSSIPTLLFGGKYDIRTPTEATKEIQESLTTATYVEFSNEGHGVLFNECSQSIRDGFISSPSAILDTACVTEIDGALKFSKPHNRPIEKPILFSRPPLHLKHLR